MIQVKLVEWPTFLTTPIKNGMVAIFTTRESFIEVQAFSLVVAFSYEFGLVSINLPIQLMFDFVKPFTTSRFLPFGRSIRTQEII